MKTGQVAWRPDLDREAVGGGGAHVPVGPRDTPARSCASCVRGRVSRAALLAPRWRGGAPARPDDRGCRGHPRIRGVVPTRGSRWAIRTMSRRIVSMPVGGPVRDGRGRRIVLAIQLSRPAEEGIGRDQGVQVTEYPSPEARGGPKLAAWWLLPSTRSGFCPLPYLLWRHRSCETESSRKRSAVESILPGGRPVAGREQSRSRKFQRLPPASGPIRVRVCFQLFLSGIGSAGLYRGLCTNCSRTRAARSANRQRVFTLR